MAKKRTFRLSQSQQRELEKNRDHHPEAYVRERCSAILKVAAGEAAYVVACQGLLKPRDPDAVYGWLTFHDTDGLASLIARCQGSNHQDRYALAATQIFRDQHGDLHREATPAEPTPAEE